MPLAFRMPMRLRRRVPLRPPGRGGTRPTLALAPAAALHDAGLAARRLAGATRAQVLRLAGTEAALVAALGTGLAAVVTAVTVAAVRRGLAGVAPPSGAAVPWVPLATIGLVCLVVAVLGSVLAASAAARDPGQTLAASAGLRDPGQTLAASAGLRDPGQTMAASAALRDPGQTMAAATGV